MRQLLLHLSIALALSMGLATSLFSEVPKAAEPVDPIVGKWAWKNGQFVTFKPDGTGAGKRATAKWKLVSKATPPTYEAVWSSGYQEQYKLVKNGEELVDAKDPARVYGHRVHEK